MMQQQQEAEMQSRQQQQQAQMEADQMAMAREDEQKELDRQNNISVAQIRAMGGLQSDINANGELDSAENLGMLKSQELADKKSIKQAELNQKSDSENNKARMQREKSLVEIQKEKIKANTALKIAKENKNKYDK